MAVNQLSLFLENKPGELMKITRILAENDINLRAINIAETVDYGILRLVADDPRKAAAILSEMDYIVSVTPMVAVRVPDVPGGLNHILEQISGFGIDIRYMYALIGFAGGYAYMVFRVQDPNELTEKLNSVGIHTADNSEIGIK